MFRIPIVLTTSLFSILCTIFFYSITFNNLGGYEVDPRVIFFNDHTFTHQLVQS